jgi:hypothetical protein
MSTRTTRVFLFVAVFLISCACVPFVLASESSFSVVWITDTQYLSQKYPNDFNNTCRWIVNNRSKYNIKMVVHTGDIVNDAWNSVEWENANHSMGILLDNGIPYCWDAGNHDDYPYWSGENYAAFNTTLMSGKPYWISDHSDGRSTAVQFKVGNWSFVIVNIEFGASDSVLTWTNSILDAHPKSYAIVATHAYLSEDCKYSTWATHLQNTVLNGHTNVFMTLNGHYHGNSNANRTLVGERNELFFDYQYLDNEKGGATVRILTFNMSEGKIHITTYKPYTAQFVIDPDNQFSLAIPTEFIPEYSSDILIMIIVLLSLSCVRIRKNQRRQTLAASP